MHPGSRPPPDKAERPPRSLPPWLDRLGCLDHFTRPPRTRRGKGVLLALLLVGGALVLLYVLMPDIVMGFARSYLPRTIEQGVVVTNVTTTAEGSPVNLALYMRPGRTRRLIGAVQGVWLPPWSLRSGQNASGTMSTGDDGLTMSWRAMITNREDHPMVILRLTPADAAELIEPYSNVTLDRGRGLEFTYAITHATISGETGPEELPDVWNLRVEGEGRIGVAMGAANFEVEVKHMVGHLRVWFHRVERGWNPAASMSIEVIEAAGSDFPFITSASTRRQLETVITANLKKRLQDIVLPPWFPIDVVLEGHIDGDAPAAARSVQAAVAPQPPGQH
ncbi:MAG: hypothetical protein H0W83_02960 [Planctomycetes bacterium]|nr:hypothetical protein [Planctomycetota bacterium]